MAGPPQNVLLSRLEQLNASLSVALDPKDLFRRAELYQSNGFPELAAADAYVGITLMDAVDDPDGDVDPDDLLPRFAGGDATHQWPRHPPGSQERANEIWTYRYAFLKLLVEALRSLDCTSDADTYLCLLKNHCREIPYDPGDGIKIPYTVRPEENESKRVERLAFPPEVMREEPRAREDPKTGVKIFGRARRIIYPWNTYEPNRMSPENVKRINEELWKVASKLEVKVVELPRLASETGLAQLTGEGQVMEKEDGKNDVEQTPQDRHPRTETIRQLGLFAREALKPGEEVLREKSFLTGQIESGMGLCDGCSGPLSTEASDEHSACSGCSKIFCDKECHELALKSFHGVPESGFWSDLAHDGPPYSTEESTERWPFCDNEATDLEDIGRQKSDEREEELYLQLAFRAIEMAERQNKHPLDLDEVKWLWGDFTDTPHKRSLPWSLKYNVIFPLQFLNTMMASHQEDWHESHQDDEDEEEKNDVRSDEDHDTDPKKIRPSRYQPYTLHHLSHYDWWVLNTLSSKFRAVASARQSSWDGTPEAAGVHWRWCLANHSCAPNVGWVWAGVGSEGLVTRVGGGGGGEGEGAEEGNVDGYMRLIVRKERVWVRPDGSNIVKGETKKGSGEEEKQEEQWEGIKAGEEILSHYCDIELPLQERRLWAKASLGGVCMCERCRYEETGEEMKEIEEGNEKLGLSDC